MIWLLALILVSEIALFALLFELKNDSTKQFFQLLNKMNESLAAIQNAHAQVINAEKISRYAFDASTNIVESFKKIDDNNTDIHNVCVMIAQEIQAAKEAQKRA